MSNIVEVSNLTFGYSKVSKLFRDLDLSIKPGHIYGLLGLNGSGKTSLLKQIIGLLFPEEGECKVFDKPAGERLPSVLSDIFVLPEEFELPPVSIRQFEEIWSPFYPYFNREDFYQYLRELKVDEGQNLNKLSYGQKKKCLLAFGLASKVRLLLMDEPTNGLDIPSKSQFRKLLARSVTDDQAIVISTHQVRDLATLIDHMILLHEGQVVFNNSLDVIASRLTFGTYSEPPEEAIYTEQYPGGYQTIIPGETEETSVDLELLFNGILEQPENIKSALKE